MKLVWEGRSTCGWIVDANDGRELTGKLVTEATGGGGADAGDALREGSESFVGLGANTLVGIRAREGSIIPESIQPRVGSPLQFCQAGFMSNTCWGVTSDGKQR